MITNPNLKIPLYSVIILLYNRTPELVSMARDCLASVRNSSENAEIIVVDNGSTVRYDWASQCNTYVRFEQNMGCSRGWNAGLLLSKGKYKVVLGDDTIVHKGYLEALREATDMGGVGQIHVEHLPHGQGIVENYKWPSGACFMLTQDILDKAGYFEEELYFPANYEDWSYWLKVYKAGFKMYRNFGFSIQHREGATLHSPDISKHTDDNKRRFIKRWGFDATEIFCGNKEMPSFTT